jgi:hypothetical protein
LQIRITGLPASVRPAVRVTGPGRYRKTVKRTRTLRRLTPGVYRVTTPRVSTPAGAATGRPSKRRVKVRAGRTVRVAATYVWTAIAPPAPLDTAAPPDTTPPGTVTALTAGPRTQDSIALSWTNPTDPDLAAVIVRRTQGPMAATSPTDGTGVALGSPTATTVTDTALNPATTYSYAVFTRDTTGNINGPTTLTTATTASPQVYSVFNYPQPGQPDPAISDELVGLLDQVPSGAQVDASFFIITPTFPVVDALIDAHGRGAAVRVVLDSGNRQSATTNDAMDATFDRLLGELGGDTGAASFAMQCDRACISKEEDSIQHNKFVLMSASGDLGDVVFQTTSNMRSGGSGDATWNAAVISSDQAEVYYFPRTDGIDTVSQTLDSVDCTSAPRIDVMATHFVRTQVRDTLNQLAQDGCGVRVVSRADNITREMCDSLVDQEVAVRIGDAPSDTAVGIHGKYLTISGGTNDHHLVWMGSHNLTDNALLRNDETFQMIDDRAVHEDFAANFATIWAEPTVTPGCGKVL